MRGIHAAVLLTAIATSASSLWANGIDRSPADPRHGTLATSGAAIFDPDSADLAPGAPGAVAGAHDRRGGAIRLAQVGPSTAPTEVSSGNPSVAPYKWVGLLTIPEPTKEHPTAGATCTGQFITPNVVLTAGHCLRDLPDNPLGPWPDPATITFYLQYQNGEGIPFKVICGATNPLWAVPSNYNSLKPDQQNAAQLTAFQHDFAMLLVNGTSPTGYMPYALDWKGKYSSAIRVGYPANILESQIVQRVPGMIFFADVLPLGGYASPNLVVQWGPVTDATQGMSGGAWIAHKEPAQPNATATDADNITIAVTSFGPVTRYNSPRYPGATFAAYLKAAEFNPLLASVSNGCK